MNRFGNRIRPFVAAELAAAREAEAQKDFTASFAHLERAHILGQASTREHVRVHWHMFRWGVRRRNLRECVGQFIRMVGAATKTALGLVPHGNTGGSNVSPFRRMPVPPDLAERINDAQNTK
jgi:Protein of unknown function (DUF3703)